MKNKQPNMIVDKSQQQLSSKSRSMLKMDTTSPGGNRDYNHNRPYVDTETKKSSTIIKGIGKGNGNGNGKGNKGNKGKLAGDSNNARNSSSHKINMSIVGSNVGHGRTVDSAIDSNGNRRNKTISKLIGPSANPGRNRDLVENMPQKQELLCPTETSLSSNNQKHESITTLTQESSSKTKQRQQQPQPQLQHPQPQHPQPQPQPQPTSISSSPHRINGASTRPATNAAPVVKHITTAGGRNSSGGGISNKSAYLLPPKPEELQQYHHVGFLKRGGGDGVAGPGPGPGPGPDAVAVADPRHLPNQIQQQQLQQPHPHHSPSKNHLHYTNNAFIVPVLASFIPIPIALSKEKQPMGHKATAAPHATKGTVKASATTDVNSDNKQGHHDIDCYEDLYYCDPNYNLLENNDKKNPGAGETIGGTAGDGAGTIGSRTNSYGSTISQNSLIASAKQYEMLHQKEPYSIEKEMRTDHGYCNTNFAKLVLSSTSTEQEKYKTQYDDDSTYGAPYGGGGGGCYHRNDQHQPNCMTTIAESLCEAIPQPTKTVATSSTTTQQSYHSTGFSPDFILYWKKVKNDIVENLNSRVSGKGGGNSSSGAAGADEGWNIGFGGFSNNEDDLGSNTSNVVKDFIQSFGLSSYLPSRPSQFGTTTPGNTNTGTITTESTSAADNNNRRMNEGQSPGNAFVDNSASNNHTTSYLDYVYKNNQESENTVQVPIPKKDESHVKIASYKYEEHCYQCYNYDQRQIRRLGSWGTYGTASSAGTYVSSVDEEDATAASCTRTYNSSSPMVAEDEKDDNSYDNINTPTGSNCVGRRQSRSIIKAVRCGNIAKRGLRSGFPQQLQRSVHFQYPPISSVKQCPRIDPDQIPNLFYSEEELDMFEDDRKSTFAVDDVEIVAISGHSTSCDDDDDNDNDVDNFSDIDDSNKNVDMSEDDNAAVHVEPAADDVTTPAGTIRRENGQHSPLFLSVLTAPIAASSSTSNKDTAANCATIGNRSTSLRWKYIPTPAANKLTFYGKQNPPLKSQSVDESRTHTFSNRQLGENPVPMAKVAPSSTGAQPQSSSVSFHSTGRGGTIKLSPSPNEATTMASSTTSSEIVTKPARNGSRISVGKVTKKTTSKKRLLQSVQIYLRERSI